MKVFDAQATADILSWEPLVGALRQGFKTGCEAPLRHHHSIAIPQEQDASLLLMPAWQSGHYIGVKHVLVVPENHRRNRPSVAASYFLYSALSGEMLAVIDGGELTNRRTAAASALASSYLSRPDAHELLIVGAGGLAPYLVAAHQSVRPIKRIKVWARDSTKARILADRVGGTVANDLNQASSQADIITCATLAEEPLILGEHVRAGTHVDLVGAFTPNMRESNNALIQSGSLFADTRSGVLSEGGDYIQPLKAGLIAESDIKGELRELCLGLVNGRKHEDEITVFKSVGTALEDLVAGVLAYESCS